MSTATLDRTASPGPALNARDFLIPAVLWNLALFGLLRTTWVDDRVVGGLVQFQSMLVAWYGTPLNAGLIVNSSCSGADVMALCAGVTLAYPVAWRRRLLGAAVGLALILTLNALRIASLHVVASDVATLDLLHLYVWPTVLTLVTVLYVFLWIRAAEGGTREFSRRWMRFGVAGLGALLVYAASAPWVLTSAAMHQAGVYTATTGAWLIGSVGTDAHVTSNVLVTSRGAFQVTQECLFTPMLPLYLAAVCVFPLRRRWAWILAALPLFFLLGVARLLLLALPPYLSASPVFLAHGFYQFVLGGVLVVLAAHVVERETTGWRASGRSLGALGVAAGAWLAAAALWEPVLLRAASLLQSVAPFTITTLTLPGDTQGALAVLPAFQMAFVAALWVALSTRRRLGALAIALWAVGASQVVCLMAAGAGVAWMGVEPHALIVRAWAVAVPCVVALLVTGRPATLVGDATYARFWNDVGEHFPSLTGAPSTAYYLANEQRLLREALPTLAGCSLLKTDLWDEARNTRILQWAADQGARVYGIDLSRPVVRQATAAFGRRPLHSTVSDVRRLPFADASFDAVYSMGTIEHFDESDASVHELARVLKPGGRLILGVPNRYDPFLRPLMVALLSRLGLYGYGYEKSYSRRALRGMLHDAGLEVVLDSGVLFMPGWLRMLDLWCHTRVPAWTRMTRALLQPFIFVDRHVPAARRHGYLIASVGARPAHSGLVAAGAEYVVDAYGCDPAALRSPARLKQLFADVVHELSLNVAAPPVWHVFPGEGGITGMVLLSESHLTIHTYPETGLAAINLYCCRPEAALDWAPRLRASLCAREVHVRRLARGSRTRS